MPDTNVAVTIPQPNQLYEGTSPYAPFEVRFIQLYRYSSAAAARSATSVAPGTLATTFTLKTIDQPVTEDAGPWRYAWYDSSQDSNTHYRWRVADATLALVSDLSYIWQADGRDSLSLKNIMLEVGSAMGGEGGRHVATAGDVNGLTAKVFQSTLLDAYSHKGQWVWNEANGEEVRVGTIIPASGAATFDRPVVTPFTNGTIFQLHALLQPSELINIINRVRGEMFVLTWVHIGLNGEDTYAAPEGVYSEDDIVAADVGQGYTNSSRVDYRPVHVNVEFDGFRAWLRPRLGSLNYSTLRVRVRRSIRDMEGDLVGPTDTTQALMNFLRPAVAWEAYRWLSEGDPDDEGFFQLTGMKRLDVTAAATRYQPHVVRAVAPRELYGPGMVR
jgi:hypothetical protein